MLDMIIRQARTLNEEIFDIGIQQGKICQIAKRSKNPHKRSGHFFRISIFRQAGLMIMSIVLKK